MANNTITFDPDSGVAYGVNLTINSGADFKSTFAVGFTSAAGGEFQISLGSTDTRNLKKGRHVYDILVSSGSTIYTIVSGNIMVQGGISSAP